MVMARNSSIGKLVLSLPLVLSACATNGSHPTSLGEGSHGVEQLLVMAEREDRMQIEGAGEVVISSTYTAASGRQCRKLATVDGVALPLRSCEDKKGGWYTTRSISVSDPFAQSTTSVAASTAVAESVSMTLNAGESLWSFASRVTGSAMNWKKIAEFNNIDDVDSVWANQSLEVESSLLRD